MKPQTLPIKRRPVKRGALYKLSAVTRSRKQRVAAAPTAGEIEGDEGSSRISRALTIIFLIHIVAVGLIFFHKHFLEGRNTKTASGTSAPAAVIKPAAGAAAVVSSPSVRDTESLPRLSSGDTVYVVKPGDNYTRIADREGVSELDLREANQNVEIRPGLILSVPPRRIVAEEPAVLVQAREQHTAPPLETPVDDGLVAAIDVNEAPRANPVQTQVAEVESAPPSASGRTHVVKSGDNIWRISQTYKVKQDELMKLNKITDPRKVRIGMELRIPE